MIPALICKLTNKDSGALVQSMLKDFLLGEHLLLMGNQGVGKNKLTDHFLKLLRREREYIQLHRDTTVRRCLCLVFPLPSWLRHCLCLAVNRYLR